MRIAMDIETYKIKDNKYKLGFGYKDILIGIYDGKYYREFKTFKETIEYIENNYPDKICVYTHYGGGFDYLYLLNEININLVTNIKIISGKIIFTYNGKIKIIFKDSILMLPDSLKNLGESFNKKHFKKDLNYKKYYALSTISEYLKYDCLTLYHVLKNFENEIKTITNNPDFNLNKYHTLAGLSFSILNKNYLDGGIKNYLTKEEEIFIRNGYYGGRTEIYKMHGKNLNYYDVNSLYPSRMESEIFPYGKHFIAKEKKIIEKCLNKNMLGIVECEVNYPKNKICLLPYRKNNKLYFPYGKFKGWYTTPEILKGLSIGVKFKFIKGLFYYKKKKIFSKFVNDFYGMKKNSIGAKRYIAKLLLNSSYGKFGQKRKMKEIMSHQQAYKTQNKIKEFDILGDEMFYMRDKETYINRLINPIYAIYITAYSRLYMFSIFEKLGFNNLYYTDTDSIITSSELPDLMIDKTEIGLLSIEDKIKKGYFIMPKLYAYENDCGKIIIKSKGINKLKKKNLSLENFKQLTNFQFGFTDKKLLGFLANFKRLDTRDNGEMVNFVKINKKFVFKSEKRIVKGNDVWAIEIKK